MRTRLQAAQQIDHSTANLDFSWFQALIKSVRVVSVVSSAIVVLLFVKSFISFFLFVKIALCSV